MPKTDTALFRNTVDPAGDIVLISPYDPQTDVPSTKVSEKEDQTSKTEEDEKEITTQLENREILVSSKVLSTASPVFQAMLDGGFLEAVHLSESKASPEREPFQLLLPDDDWIAMLLLCRILHFKVDKVPDMPNTKLLLALATVCDKYHCTQALKHCASLWIRNWTEPLSAMGNSSIEDLSRLLILAYVADLPHEFSGVAWKLFLHHKGPIAGAQTQAGLLTSHPLLHQNAGEYLDRKRLRFCEAYHRAVTAPWTTWAWKSLKPPGCCRARHAVMDYTLALRTSEIVPYELDLSDHTFSSLFRSTDHLPDLSVGACTSRNHCGCLGDPTESLTGDLRALSANTHSYREWFGCLDCLRSGDVSNKDRKCRIEHDDISKLLA